VASGLRSARERLIQTLWFEGLGLVLVAPLYAWAAGAGVGDSFVMVAAVSVVMMGWTALFDTLFDITEYRLTGRVASERPHGLRSVHAMAHEVSGALVSCPVIYALTPLSWGEALLADIGLSLTYAAYAYLFHWGFDRLRPVARAID
jgi:uncharacterized membrane protein